MATVPVWGRPTNHSLEALWRAQGSMRRPGHRTWLQQGRWGSVLSVRMQGSEKSQLRLLQSPSQRALPDLTRTVAPLFWDPPLLPHLDSSFKSTDGVRTPAYRWRRAQAVTFLPVPTWTSCHHPARRETTHSHSRLRIKKLDLPFFPTPDYQPLPWPPRLCARPFPYLFCTQGLNPCPLRQLPTTLRLPEKKVKSSCPRGLPSAGANGGGPSAGALQVEGWPSQKTPMAQITPKCYSLVHV